MRASETVVQDLGSSAQYNKQKVKANLKSKKFAELVLIKVSPTNFKNVISIRRYASIKFPVSLMPDRSRWKIVLINFTCLRFVIYFESNTGFGSSRTA